jgi:hypothetical protein
MDTSKTYKPARWILYLFILFNVISYLYVIFEGKYNGDYLGTIPRSSQQTLFFYLIYTILPYVGLYLIYDYYAKMEKYNKITIPYKSFGWFLLLVILFQIITTKIYGVGKLGQEYYEAPTAIKLLIQIFNRFNAILGVSIYSVAAPKKNKLNYLLWILVFILSFERASFMVFAITGLMFILLYFGSIWGFIKKHLILSIVLLFISPIAVTTLYNVRNQIRTGSNNIELKIDQDKDNTFSKVIFGRLIGRLSSYSNSVIIHEQKIKIKELTQNFSIWRYPTEAISAVYGKILNPNEIAYRNLQYESFGYHSRTYSAMNGTLGALLIGYYQSPLVFFINLSTILLIVVLTFELFALFHNRKLFDMIFLFFSLNVLSGNAEEYMATLMVTFLYVIIFLCLNLIEVPKDLNNKKEETTG